jgi:hypothetical protein
MSIVLMGKKTIRLHANSTAWVIIKRKEERKNPIDGISHAEIITSIKMKLSN